MIVKQAPILNWCIQGTCIAVPLSLWTFCLSITQVYAHEHVKCWTGIVQLTESKNVCKQNVKWKPTVSAHFYEIFLHGLLSLHFYTRAFETEISRRK